MAWLEAQELLDDVELKLVDMRKAKQECRGLEELSRSLLKPVTRSSILKSLLERYTCEHTEPPVNLRKSIS